LRRRDRRRRLTASSRARRQHLMTLGWGIVGTGTAADRLVGPGVDADPESEIVAVVSRDQSRAEEFAGRHGARHAYTRYEDLLADPEVDIVYIATPNAHHASEAI